MKKSNSENSNPSGVRKREPRNLYRNKIDKKRSASGQSFKKQTETQRSKSSQSWVKENPLKDTEFVNPEHNQSYKKFLNTVYCPFCLKIQEDKLNLIKHLDINCRWIIKKRIQFAQFQILPTNSIKCNYCPDFFNSTENYFFHATLQHGNAPEYLFCSCCKILIPGTHTNLECHLLNDIHNTRRKSVINSNYFLKDGIYCIYCMYNGMKKFKCLSCPPPDFLFDNSLDITNHFKTSKHLKNIKKNYLMSLVYCCFCDKNLNKFEIVYHFVSEHHLERENKIIMEGSYELCIYCGSAYNNLENLSIHMRSNCDVINKIKKEMGWKKTVEETDVKITQNKEHVIKKERCILVNCDVDIIELVKTLKNFGKIIYVGPYGDRKLVIEFKNEAAIEFILLMSSFIKVNDEKIHIEFMQGAEGGADV